MGGDPLRPRTDVLAPDPSLVKNILARLVAHSSKRIYRTIGSDSRPESPIETSAALSEWSMLCVLAARRNCSDEMRAVDSEFTRAGFLKIGGLVLLPNAESSLSSVNFSVAQVLYDWLSGFPHGLARSEVREFQLGCCLSQIVKESFEVGCSASARAFGNDLRATLLLMTPSLRARFFRWLGTLPAFAAPDAVTGLRCSLVPAESYGAPKVALTLMSTAHPNDPAPSRRPLVPPLLTSVPEMTAAAVDFCSRHQVALANTVEMNAILHPRLRRALDLYTSMAGTAEECGFLWEDLFDVDGSVRLP